MQSVTETTFDPKDMTIIDKQELCEVMRYADGGVVGLSRQSSEHDPRTTEQWYYAVRSLHNWSNEWLLKKIMYRLS